MKRKLLLLAAILLLMAARPVFAAALAGDDPPVMGPGEFLQRWWEAAQADVITGIERGFCQVLWAFDRFAIMVYQQVVESHAIQQVKDVLLEAVANLMPDVLRNLFFGSGTGLMYVALMLAGIAMAAVPLLNGATLVRLDRVIIWGVLITALFISSGFGYDLVNGMEAVRTGMMKSVSQNGGADIQTITVTPMQASGDEVKFDFSFVLPKAFQEEYFPDPQTQTYQVIFVDLPALPQLKKGVDVETEESIEQRKAKAASGVVISIFAALGGVLILMFALAYGLLDLAAITTLLFLFASLPLGFFEFGVQLVGDTLKRYLEIAVVGLVVAIFTAISGTLLTKIIGSQSPSEMGLAALYMLLTITLLRSAVSRALSLAMNAGKQGYQSLRATVTSGVLVAAGAGIAASAATSAPAKQGGGSLQSEIGRLGAHAVVGAAIGALGGGGFAGAVAGAVQGVARGARQQRGNVFRNNGR